MKAMQIKIKDQFWNYYRNLVKDVMIPYQWQVLNDEIDITSAETTSYYAKEKSHALRNLRIAAGLATGQFHGQWFQDSDVYKWLEAAAYVWKFAPNQDLATKINQVVALIGAAQQPDGYLDTYFQLVEPTRKLKHVAKSHELYCMGHYIEAGCAVYQVLGNQQALTIATKMADFIAIHFGPAENQLHGYPGHPEIELALMKLADLTQQKKYQRLAQYLINTRGTQPNFFTDQAQTTAKKEEAYWGGPEPKLGYFQADVPVRDIKMAEGHAVRMVYLLTGMTHVARATHDDSLLTASQRLYHDVVDHQMYLTGGVGATANGEAFTFDDDLPNDIAYAETCAACGMVFLTKQLLQAAPDGQYADVMERELFNGTISGMALDGQHFFYVNPLEVDPVACAQDPNKHHVLPTRPAWLACACCPPNLARLIGSLDQYIYTIHDQRLYVDQFIGSELYLDNGIKIEQHSGYPWSGKIKLTVTAPQSTQLSLNIRIPAWCHDKASLTVDGTVKEIVVQHGYTELVGDFVGQTVIVLTLPMTATEVTPNPAIRADIGKVAIQRGPLVYCLEQADNGSQLPWLTIPAQAELTTKQDSHSFAIPVTVIEATGQRRAATKTDHTVPTQLRFIPYFAWANRQVGEMLVWVDQQG